MRPVIRKQLTLRGLGDDVTDDIEEEAPPSRIPATCRAPEVAPNAAMRYSFVAPRRETLSMPLPESDDPKSRRRPTARMAYSIDEA